MKNTPILDVACGGKMFYFDKENPNVTFMDIRKVKTTLCDGRSFEVAPDIVGDFTAIPFEDNSFRMVVFDPPHLLRNTGKSKFADICGSLNEKAEPAGYQQIKYGALYSDWKDMLTKGFKECFRVLSPGGFLIFKWNETDIKVREVLSCTDQKPVFGHRSGKRSNTHWICFMKEGAQMSEKARMVRAGRNNDSKKNIIETYLYTEKQMECLQKSIDQYNERYEKRPLDIQ